MIENDALYITDLHHETTEVELRKAFAEFIEDSYPLVITGRNNKPSCAKLFLGNAEIANKCISNGRFRKIHGVTCQVCFLTDESSQKYPPNICVKNLNPSTTTEDLYNLFVKKFEIIKLSIVMNEKCESKGIGFVTVKNNDDINSFISTFNDFELDDNKITVQQYYTPNGSSDRVSRTVCVKNFGSVLNEDQLRVIFEDVGNVEKVAIAQHPDGGSKGFGFVTFFSAESAKLAVQTLNMVTVFGRTLMVDPEKPKVNKGLYVSNLDPLVDINLLNSLFEPFGRIKDIKMPQSDTGTNRGFAIFQFETVNATKKALKNMNKYVLNGKPLDVMEVISTYTNRSNDNELINDLNRLNI